jgi:HEAT repeat protein
MNRLVDAERSQQIAALASDAQAPLYGRVAAIFTLNKLDGAISTDFLVKLAGDASIREFALRALTDRRNDLANLPLDLFVKSLGDDNPRVQAQALVSLGRIGNVEAADEVLALTTRNDKWSKPTASPLHAQRDIGRVMPHLALQSLVAMNAVDACLAALDSPQREGALLALRNMHDERAVKVLANKLSATQDAQLRRDILSTLVRLYHREGEYKGGWWGTRPDNVGPYFDRQKWAASDEIAAVLKTAAREDRGPSSSANSSPVTW